MNYLRDIEVESHASEGYVNILTRTGEPSCVEFYFVRDDVVVNPLHFQQFVERDDVSLSMDERMKLLAHIEEEIRNTID